MSSSSFSLESATLLLQHPTPRHWPYAGEHSKLCLRQLHLAVLQSVVHLHLMMRSRSSGAGGRSVITGSRFPSFSIHSTLSLSDSRCPPSVVPAGIRACCDTLPPQKSGAMFACSVGCNLAAKLQGIQIVAVLPVISTNECCISCSYHVIYRCILLAE